MNKCPICEKPWVKAGCIFTTLVGYWSEPGHDHDDNCKHRTYICPEGHETEIYIRRTCPDPNCNWKGKTTCFCHKAEKVLEDWPELEPTNDANT